jgi:hypothetical protein
VNTIRAGRCGNYIAKAELVDGNCCRQVALLGRPGSHSGHNRLPRQAIFHDGVVHGKCFLEADNAKGNHVELHLESMKAAVTKSREESTRLYDR